MFSNLDSYIINEREKSYNSIRENVFITMCKKHYKKSCSCVKKDKSCNITGIVDLSKFGNEEYLKELYTSGVLDGLYNIMQSITQSLKSTTGTNFENIIENVFIKNSIDYSSQVKLTDGHTVDFTIPSSISPLDPKNFEGSIISCKTTLRERYLQDKYLGNKLVVITTEQVNKNDIRVVSINKDTKNFTKWFNDIQSNKQMKVIDLFCGWGFSQGFQDAGFEIVAAIDIWDKAIETYKDNHKHLALCKDLVSYTPNDLEKEHNITNVDVIIGGPTCQGFSNAGKRDKNDPRNSLFIEYLKYVNYYNPSVFIMENVMR